LKDTLVYILNKERVMSKAKKQIGIAPILQNVVVPNRCANCRYHGEIVNFRVKTQANHRTKSHVDCTNTSRMEYLKTTEYIPMKWDDHCNEWKGTK
jgi:hypothetical protein